MVGSIPFGIGLLTGLVYLELDVSTPVFLPCCLGCGCLLLVCALCSYVFMYIHVCLYANLFSPPLALCVGIFRCAMCMCSTTA